MTIPRREFVRLASWGVAARALHASPGNRACILLWQGGGVSHLDTFDPKPDAPAGVRGDFGAIPTRVPGIRVSECLPRTAARMDKLTILRSLCAEETNHERAARVLRETLPPEPEGRFPHASRLDEEPSRVRDRYGRTAFGERCLRARRLIEAGSRFVTVNHGRDLYDTHAHHFALMRERVLPEFDRAFAALVEDLDERGLLAATLVIATGEFGRSRASTAGADATTMRGLGRLAWPAREFLADGYWALRTVPGRR